MVLAEDVYTQRLRYARFAVWSGSTGSIRWDLSNRSVWIDWEVRANPVWRAGRLFLPCPKCHRLATRIYFPTADSSPGCRRCWGLTYESRQHRNYKDGGYWMGYLGVSSRSFAHLQTDEARQRRAAAAAELAPARIT